jgi:type IV secretory pathway VirJ component
MTLAVAIRTTGARRRHVGQELVWLAGLLAAAACLFLSYIGWFGGPLYTAIPAAGNARPRIVAVILSGDMGFRFGMAARVAARLSERGVAVVGINSLTFLRGGRSPAEAAALLAGGIARAEALAPGAHLVLIGQSAGADALQVGLAALHPGLRKGVGLVALVVPGRRIRLEASPSELFPLRTPEVDGLGSARRLGWAPTLCIQGMAERDSLCPFLTQGNIRRIALPGGHPLHRDAERVAGILLDEIARRLGPPR